MPFGRCFAERLSTGKVAGSELPSSGSQSQSSEAWVQDVEEPAEARDVQDNAYLRKNLDHFRQQKRQLELQVENMESRLRNVEAQKYQYQKLFEDSQGSFLVNGEGRDLEITGLHQQLGALLLLKDALNSENLKLRDRIQGLEQSQRQGQACVRGAITA
ncbi:unnamed protein product [Effrenium voratum]|nr:unnamed protein product [Effrenium voratum]